MLSLREFLKKFSTIDDKFIDDFTNLYDPKSTSKYPIDLDKLADWLHAPKGNLKKTLTDSYIKKIDYKIIKLPNKGKIGGQGKEQILLTSDCFKMLIMKSQTKKSESVRKYYLELEKLLNKYNDYIVEGMSEKYDLPLSTQEHNTTPSKGIMYIIQTTPDVTLHKIGKSKRIKNNIRNYTYNEESNIRPVLVFETNNIDHIEACIKNDIKKNKCENYKSIYQVDINILKKIIDEYYHSTKELSLIKENDTKKHGFGKLYVMIDKEN